MSESSSYGSAWTDGQLDLIVADYFAMLGDLAGRPYSKARHNAMLTEAISRTRGSVEYKYQNISAVLDMLGMPWIPGYKPAVHHQGAIAAAIERYLSLIPAAVDASVAVHHIDSVEGIFVAPPQPQPEEPMQEALRRLVGKFDPVERDRRHRALGKAGEQFVVELERRQLTDAGRGDLARRIRWAAEEDGDGADGSARTPFFLSRNEADTAAERPEHWRIYRVHPFARSPRVFTIAPPLETSIHLQPQTWRASF
jgi:hypothetical protein